MTTFDPDAFMQQNVDAPMATTFRVVPEGEYQAMIDDFDSSAVALVEFVYKKGPREGQDGTMTKLTVPFAIQDPALRAEFGRDKITVTAQLILDLNDRGGLDFSPDKNVKLGQLRDAVGQNTPGPWGLTQLRGAGPLMVRVTHESDKQDPEKKYARATRFAPIK